MLLIHAVCFATGRYCYMAHLLQLDRCRPLSTRSMPAHLCQVSSPLSAQLSAWRKRLEPHPDREFASYILTGIEHGFRVGFNYSQPLSSAKRNMLSASEHYDVVERYIASEWAEGRILGPVDPGSVSALHTSRFGVIPKGHASGKWRLITDLSFLDGASVNDGISPTLCSLSYTTVDKVARAAQQLGTGALLAKVNIKSAYRLVPVHPDDRPLLGVIWKGAYLYRHYVAIWTALGTKDIHCGGRRLGLVRTAARRKSIDHSDANSV